MFFWCFSVTFFFVCANVISSPLIQCKLTDVKCFDKSGPSLFAKFIEGDPALGTEDLDPMHHDVIDGNLSDLKFKLTDTTVKGLKDCTIENVKLNPATLGLHADMICPFFKMYGKYNLNGRISLLPVEGTGDYSITTKKYLISVDVELKVVQGKDGKSYIAVKNFRLKPEPLEPVVYDFKNLFNGQKDLSDTTHKFVNENWKEVAYEIQDPVFKANFKKIIKNANKLLKSIPIENLIQL